MSGKDYKIDFSAADPSLYSPLFAEQISTVPNGRDSNPLSGATDINSVESLAPENLALGQIVPFEFRISVDTKGKVNGDTITVTAGWETVTTNGGLFGYDGDLGVIAAFVDSSDPNASGDTDATVSDFSWKLVGTEIQGTFEITNLDPGEEIVLEAWVVLQDEIPEGINGNVKSRLINAETLGIIEAGDKINTGNQTIPLQQVQDLSNPQEDSLVITTDSDPLNIDTTTPGVFTVNANGEVQFDYLFDGGGYKGELAIFSLRGMENLEVGSSEFLQEAANRALSNSDLGYVVIQDESDRARFGDTNNELNWEGNYNGGLYEGPQSFSMLANDTFAMMLVNSGTVEEVATNSNTNLEKTFFSFGTINPEDQTVLPQMVDIDGNGNAFGWEDVNFSAGSDRDFNDMVIQVQGATTTAPLMDDEVYSNRDWRTTEVGQELLEYANRPVFETGTFKVNSTGKVQFDYLFDGGWFEGELAVFSLKGMETYEPGSQEFIYEAARRALTNSESGRILLQDRESGAKFTENLAWESNFNAGEYEGIKTFDMTEGDELAFMLVQHTSVEEIYQNPNTIDRWGKLPIFSIPEANPFGTAPNQIVAVDDNGTLAFEDVRIDQGKSDQDYNDVVFQVRGLESNISTMDENINSERDWRTTATGQELLEYADRTVFEEGVFTVGESGEMTFDFLYDGGWFQGELAVFNLEGMENFEVGSQAFIQEAANRALSNSELGRILVQDPIEGARFTETVAWEANFNSGEYQGIKNFSMNPGDEFAVMLIQHTTVQEIANNPSKTNQWGKKALFSIPEANPGGESQGQIVDIDGNGSFAMEDLALDGNKSDRDYNDMVFQIKGADATVASIDEFSNPDRDWRTTAVGEEILEYANRAVFDEGVFQVGESGEVIIDFLYDGGWFQGAEVGIFSLAGMDSYEIGSEAFVQEVIDRVKSNSTEGYVVTQDANEGAKHTSSFDWEGNYNDGAYKGRQTFSMNAGDTLGLVLIPDGTMDEALSAPDWAVRKDPLFSMSAANTNEQIQFVDIFTGAEGTIVGFEDVQINSNSNKDYNDIVLAIEGVERIGLTDIEDVISTHRNWLDTEVGLDIINYFDSELI